MYGLLTVDTELCEYCRCSDYGSEDYHGEILVGRNEYYLCEGNWCQEAYRDYLAERKKNR